MTDAEGVRLVVGSGDAPDLHAEGALYNAIGEENREGLKIGISNYHGPCPSCEPYFQQQQAPSNVNIYYPDHYWRP
jgi:hypothetical protein